MPLGVDPVAGCAWLLLPYRIAGGLPDAKNINLADSKNGQYPDLHGSLLH